MQTASQNAPGVFLSYAPPPEKKLRSKLLEALSPLSSHGLITIWPDDQGNGSADTTHLFHRARILLLLVSPACLASPAWNRQAEAMLARAHSGHARVIPVLLRQTVAWQQTSFGHLIPLPVEGRPVTSFSNQTAGCFAVASGLHDLVARELPAISELQSPPGSAPPAARLLLTRPPIPHPLKSVPRPQVVAEIYQRLSSSEVSALILTGIWGLGKSEVAAQVCQLAEQQRQSGQGSFVASPLWFTLTETTSLGEICASLCLATGSALPEFQRMTPSDLVVTLYDLLEQTPRLVVLDQLENWLAPQTSQPRLEHPALGPWLELLNSRLCASRLLFTSWLYPQSQRQPLAAYVQRQALCGLSPAQGLQVLGAGQLQESERELISLVSYYQGHPRALAWIRDLLSGTHVASLSSLVHDLAVKQRFASDSAHSILHYIYIQQLTEEQRALLQAFVLYRRPVPLLAAQQLVGSRQRTLAGTSLCVLLDLGLLQARGLLMYCVPPVIRDVVVAEPAESGLPDAPAHRTAASYYQTHAASLSSQSQASEQRAFHMLEAAWHLSQAGEPLASAHLLQREQVFCTLSRQGEQALLLELYQHLLASTSWDTIPALAGQFYHELGSIHNALGQKTEACQACQRALAFLRQTDEPALLVATLNELGTVYRSLNRLDLAHACYQEAWTHCEHSNGLFSQRGITLNNQGRLLYTRAQEQERQHHTAQAHTLYEQARTLYQQALALYQRHQLPEEEGWTLLNLADVCAARGERPPALALYHRALSHFRDLGERRGEGTVLNNLGLLLAYDPATREQAAGCYTQALHIFRAVGDRWQERLALRNLGYWLLLCVPAQEPASARTYLGPLACFFASRDPLAHPAHRRADLLPNWLLASLRQELGESGCEECLQAAETRCWQTIEELLQIPRHCV